MLHLVLLAACVSAQTQTQPPAGTLSGRVVNSLNGEPIKKALIELQLLAPPQRQTGQAAAPPAAMSAVSDASGHFSVGQLPDGQYYVRATHPNYPVSRQSLRPNQGTPATVGGATPAKDLTLSLTPGGSLSGRVTDADGDPLTGFVQLWERNPFGASPKFTSNGGSTIDENGEFHFRHTPAGRYIVMVRPSQSASQPHPLMTAAELSKRPQRTYPPLFYPNAEAPEQAEPLVITAGGSLDGIEVKVSPVLAVQVSGRLVFPESVTAPAQYVNLSLLRRKADSTLDMMPATSTGAAPGKDFVLSAVTPGSYTLVLSGQSAEQVFYASQPLEVGTEAISGVNVRVQAGMEIPLVVTVETDANVKGPQQAAQLFFQPVMGSFNYSQPREKKLPGGGSVLQRLVPGRYRVIRFPGYVRSMRFGDKEISGQIFEVTGSESGPLSIFVSEKLGDVRGTLQGYKSGVKVSVVLIPVSDEMASIGEMRQTMVSDDGRFQIQAAPGEYFAIGVDPSNGQVFRNSMLREWLKQNATRVQVDADAPATPVVNYAAHETLEQALLEAQQKPLR